MELKNYPLMPPILKRPDFGEPFILQTDWCREAIAAVLCQVFDGKKHPSVLQAEASMLQRKIILHLRVSA